MLKARGHGWLWLLTFGALPGRSWQSSKHQHDEVLLPTEDLWPHHLLPLPRSLGRQAACPRFGFFAWLFICFFLLLCPNCASRVCPSCASRGSPSLHLSYFQDASVADAAGAASAIGSCRGVTRSCTMVIACWSWVSVPRHTSQELPCGPLKLAVTPVMPK